MPEVKQFSLFIPHEAPVETEPEVNETVVEEVSSKASNKINLYSESAARLLKEKEYNKNKISVVKHASDGFVLKSCRACNGTRLVNFNNVYMCRTCGSENTYTGVLFGDKVKRGDKK